MTTPVTKPSGFDSVGGNSLPALLSTDARTHTLLTPFTHAEKIMMNSSIALFFRLLAIGCLALMTSSCGSWLSAPKASAPPPVPAAARITEDALPTQQTIRLLEEQVHRNPDDFIAYNKLAGYYLQLQRESGSAEYIGLAERAVRSSLAVLPAAQNRGALAAQSSVEFTAHQFVAARDHAQQLLDMDKGKSAPYQLLSDALIELGDYEQADRLLTRLQQLSGLAVGTETRLARLAALRGEADKATKHLSTALLLAREQLPTSSETVAWIYWQLGEAAFSIGDYQTAELRYRDSLITFPDYYRALAGLGRALAAQSDLSGAIEQVERAVKKLPDLTMVAALGDLYLAAGREKEAADQFALVEKIGKLSTQNGALYNRQLALFYADHDEQAEAAYQNALREYETRRDIYGADAVAWTALKAGKIAEAQAAIKEALKLGTRDAKLYYHAGMIAQAVGETAQARAHLVRALQLSPRFDVLQAARAEQALKELN